MSARKDWAFVRPDGRLASLTEPSCVGSKGLPSKLLKGHRLHWIGLMSRSKGMKCTLVSARTFPPQLVKVGRFISSNVRAAIGLPPKPVKSRFNCLSKARKALGIGQNLPSSFVSLPMVNGAMVKHCGNLPVSTSNEEKRIGLSSQQGLAARVRSRHENQRFSRQQAD